MTEQQALFLEFLFGPAKGDVRKAMDLAGYPEETPLEAVTEPLKKNIEEGTRGLISVSSPKAVFKLLGILDGSNPDDFLGSKEKIAVAKDLLDRAGISKVEKMEVEAKTPLFILPAKKNEEEDAE